MKFPLERFNAFCSRLVIDSKEHGQMTLAPENQLGTQKQVIEEIVRGLEDDIHFFVDLKARQLGVTTITLALDLFWHWQHAGMQGTLAADSEENRDMFRSTLAMYYDGLPKSHRIALVQNNRNFMSFKNRSRLLMQIGGGKKSKGGKGRGKGLTFMHATEVSSWEDEESLASILSSLAEHNPNRLYLFETTARGFNMFHDIWTTAKRATTQRAIFTGWWRNQMYCLKPEHPAYRVYWDGHLTGPEKEWVRAIKLQYGYEISPGQMAWWRWKLAEVVNDDNLMLQEFPPTEELAFILSGKNFFSLPRLNEVKKEIDLYEAPTAVRFIYAERFSDTMLEETIESQSELLIWEMPDPRGIYSIGADPAYGSSDWADRFVVEVYRCYADRFEQVAEFCTADMNTYRYAWVLMYLAGLYRNTMINLEINGPGQAVFAEMQAIRKMAASMSVAEGGRDLTNFLGHMQYYLFRRMDSMGGGAVYHFKTTFDSKEMMLNLFRDLVDRKEAALKSEGLLDEMKIIVREEGFLGASGRAKDDRVIASALAAVQYHQYLKYSLAREGRTYAKEHERRMSEMKAREEGKQILETPMTNALGKNVGEYLKSIGMKK